MSANWRSLTAALALTGGLVAGFGTAAAAEPGAARAHSAVTTDVAAGSAADTGGNTMRADDLSWGS